MHADSLPESILIKILQYLLYNHEKPAVSLKNNLYILSISSKLRRLGVPLVYNTLFIYPREHHRNITYSDLFANPQGILGPEITTNLDLVYEGNLPHTTKCLRIGIYFVTNPFPAIQTMLNCMNSISIRWYSISSLHLTFTPEILYGNTDDNNGSKQNQPLPESHIPGVCNLFYKMFPGVHKLTFNEATRNVLIREFCGRLTIVYAGRLQQLISRVQFYMPQDVELTKLNYACLDFANEFNSHACKINPDSLVSLKLTNGTATQLWSLFDTKMKNGIIGFPNLLFLSIVYSSWSSSGLEYSDVVPTYDNQPCKLHFPKLQTLFVNDSHCLNAFISCGIFPAKMYSITIHTSAEGIRILQNHKLPHTERLAIALDMTTSSPSTLQLANNIFSEAKPRRGSRLLVFNNEIPVHPRNMTCMDLTYLLVTSKLDIDTMVKLIVKLRNLAGFEIYNLVPGHKKAIASCDQDCKPFDTKLQTLSLYFNESDFSVPSKLVVLQYLLLRIPALEQVITSEPAEPLYDFVSGHVTKYPHLKNINFRFS
ncbi:hypothetical protein BX667DRAFT_522344 [Coemansia mojavensis]|nr:hypothetical protein BX667DRAFT_522344 [Coemansia mojavensis]